MSISRSGYVIQNVLNLTKSFALSLKLWLFVFPINCWCFLQRHLPRRKTWLELVEESEDICSQRRKLLVIASPWHPPSRRLSLKYQSNLSFRYNTYRPTAYEEQGWNTSLLLWGFYGFNYINLTIINWLIELMIIRTNNLL